MIPFPSSRLNAEWRLARPLGNPLASVADSGASALGVGRSQFLLIVAAVVASGYFGGKFFGRVFPKSVKTLRVDRWGPAAWQKRNVAETVVSPTFDGLLAGTSALFGGALATFFAKKVKKGGSGKTFNISPSVATAQYVQDVGAEPGIFGTVPGQPNLWSPSTGGGK